MLNFLLKRLAAIIPTLFFVSVLIFGLQQLLPGDPAIAMAGEDRDPNVIAYLRDKLPDHMVPSAVVRLMRCTSPPESVRDWRSSVR